MLFESLQTHQPSEKNPSCHETIEQEPKPSLEIFPEVPPLQNFCEKFSEEKKIYPLGQTDQKDPDKGSEPENHCQSAQKNLFKNAFSPSDEILRKIAGHSLDVTYFQVFLKFLFFSSRVQYNFAKKT